MATFAVFHDKNPKFGLRDASETATRLRLFPWGYDEVAHVEANEVGATFGLTNHIDRPWWENEGVTLIGEPNHRSTSVGDIVWNLDNGEVWLCENVGWKFLFHRT